MAKPHGVKDWNVEPEDAHQKKLLAKAGKGDGKAGIGGSAFNLANAIIGAGVGGMPYALREAGFFSGMILMATVACCSDYSVRMLIKLGKQADKHYYEQLVQSQFGHAGYVAVSAAMGIFAYGAMVAYLIGISGTMSLVFGHWAGVDVIAHPWVTRAVLITISVCLVLPLASLKNMAVLSKTSALSLLCVIFIIFVVIANAAGPSADTKLPRTEAQKELLFIDSNFFPAIGIIAFAFVCHHACFIVYNTLRDNTPKRWAMTVHLTLGIALSFMFVLAVSAYLTFRGIMNSNFLTNYSMTDEVVNTMRCMFAVCQILTYPIELFVARHAIHALFFASSRKFTDQQHYVITLMLWSSSLAIALNVTDLGIVLELTGGISAVFIGFVMPAMLAFKMNLSPLEWRLWKNPRDRLWPAIKEHGPAWFILIFGLLAMIFTLITVFTNLVSGEGGPHDAYEHETAAHHTAGGGSNSTSGGGGGGHGGSDGVGPSDPVVDVVWTVGRRLLAPLFAE